MTYIAERITISDDLCGGKPTIRGMRISVETILEFIGAGNSIEDILIAYPFLEHDDITACLQFASEMLKSKFGIMPKQII